MESLWVVAPPDENYLYIELLLVEYYRRNPGIGKSRHGNRQAEIREPEAPLAEKPNWWKSCKCSGHPIGGNLVKILQSKLCEQKRCSGKFCRSKPFLRQPCWWEYKRWKSFRLPRREPYARNFDGCGHIGGNHTGEDTTGGKPCWWNPLEYQHCWARSYYTKTLATAGDGHRSQECVWPITAQYAPCDARVSLSLWCFFAS